MSRHGRPSASRARQSTQRLGEMHLQRDRAPPPPPPSGRRPGRRGTDRRRRAARTGSASRPGGRAGSTGRSASGSRPRSGSTGGSVPAAVSGVGGLEVPEALARGAWCRRTPFAGRFRRPAGAAGRSSMLILIWAPRGGVGRPAQPAVARRPVPPRRAGAPRPPRRVGRPSGVRAATLTPPASSSTCITSTPQRISTPRRAGPLDQRIGHRAHPADRHQPLAGAAADHVVEEAPVGQQRRIEQRGVRADQRVGGDHAADRVVAEPADDHRRRSAPRRRRSRSARRPRRPPRRGPPSGAAAARSGSGRGGARRTRAISP